jgi:hypothetical protein
LGETEQQKPENKNQCLFYVYFMWLVFFLWKRKQNNQNNENKQTRVFMVCCYYYYYVKNKKKKRSFGRFDSSPGSLARGGQLQRWPAAFYFSRLDFLQHINTKNLNCN